MTIKRSSKTVLAVALCGVLVACSSDDDSGTQNTVQTDNGTTGNTTTFEFRTEQPAAYTRVDRSAMPAIATALIASKDSYNNANPVDDISGTFVPEILQSLEFLHGALDSQLQALNLTPCTYVGDGSGTCAAFAVPLIIPDTLKVNAANAAGFPNGRLLADPVVDVTLAVALLELTGDNAPHTPTDLVGVLNPAANDKAFSESFPFLAPAH